MLTKFQQEMLNEMKENERLEALGKVPNEVSLCEDEEQYGFGGHGGYHVYYPRHREARLDGWYTIEQVRELLRQMEHWDTKLQRENND